MLKTPEELRANPFVRLHVEMVHGESHLYFKIAPPVIMQTDEVTEMEGITIVCNLGRHHKLCGCEVNYDGCRLQHRAAA